MGDENKETKEAPVTVDMDSAPAALVEDSDREDFNVMEMLGLAPGKTRVEPEPTIDLGDGPWPGVDETKGAVSKEVEVEGSGPGGPVDVRSANAPKAQEAEEELSDAPVEDPRDATIRQLQERINELAQAAPVRQPEREEEPKAETEALPEFFKEEEFDDVLSDAKAFKSVLYKASDAGFQRAVNEVRQYIPALVQHLIQQSLGARDQMEQFYGFHPHLQPVRGYVDRVIEELSVNNPNRSFEEISNKAVEIAEKQLGLSKQPFKPTVVSSREKPTLPGRSSSRQTPGTDPKGSDEFSDVLLQHAKSGFTF